MNFQKERNKLCATLFRTTFCLGSFILLASGCGGNSGSESTLLEGVFVDSPVEGMEYMTATNSGVTNSQGTFHYAQGEMITFHLGDLVFGTSMAEPLMTPIHLVDGATDETHPTVTNMASLLQSLDMDGNPENGITISAEMRQQMIGLEINFEMSTADFANHPDVVGLLDNMNEMGLFSDGAHMLTPASEAQQHLGQHARIAN